MGKKTLYHPVSLHVIRGCFEYCEFKIGRLTQDWSSIGSGTAAYTAEIVTVPDDKAGMALWQIAKHIRGCFAQDITVLWVNQKYDIKTKSSILTVKILVDIHPPTPMEYAIEDAKNNEKIHKEYLSEGIVDDN